MTTPGVSLLPLIDRGLEGLWLLAAFLIPLAFLDQQYAISEAQIAYVEVPKVALLRTLAAMMLLLWSVEWAIKSNAFYGSFPSMSIESISNKWQPRNTVLAFNKWLKVHPTRWLVFAAALFFASTFLSAALSGSRINSLWGEIPGQDGYSAYTIAAYGILFGVIATHLKRPAQLGRLIGVIVIMGCLVGFYGIFQHFGHDFLNLTESTGGGTARVTIFMGNTIFAAAVLSMTVPLTLVAASLSLHNQNWGDWGPFSKLNQLAKDGFATTIWAMILTVQLLGLMFTFSRGPWAGAVLAVAVFLGLVVLSSGWKALIKTGLVIGLAGVFAVAFLHWQGSISIINVGSWLGPALALLGLAGASAILFVIEKFGRAVFLIATTGSAVIIIGASIFALPILSDHGAAISGADGVPTESTGGQATRTVASIAPEILSGFSHGRGTHWKVSWKLIKDRPWFEFDDLSLPWLRPFVGYGPDLFRYTYLLESPVGDYKFLPHEPDHAHNFFIHQTVEQGILGGLASLALFVSVFGVVAHRILRSRHSGNSIYRLLLLGLMAIVAGRFLEMMVGVARISDLTVLWVILGIFAALINFDDSRQESDTPEVNQISKASNRSDRHAAKKRSAAQSISTGFIIRLAVVAWLIGGIGVLTWQKGINPVRASIAEGRAVELFNMGDLANSVKELEKAIKLAPGVPKYYANLAEAYQSYRINSRVIIETSCIEQEEVTYQICLALKSFDANLTAVNQQPFSYYAQIAAGNSAYNLQMNEFANESYSNAATMVPNSYLIQNIQAKSEIDNGSYDLALELLEISLNITGDSTSSLPALVLKGRAQLEIDDFNGAEKTLKRSIALEQELGRSSASLDMIHTLYKKSNLLDDVDYFDQQINQNPTDSVASYFRGLEHLRLGNLDQAVSDIGKGVSLGLTTNQVSAILAYARMQTRIQNGANLNHQEDQKFLKALYDNFGKIVDAEPNKALYNAYFAESKILEGKYLDALSSSVIANKLDPELVSAYLSRAEVYIHFGMNTSAREVLDASMGLDFATALDYVKRGEIFAFLGEEDQASIDLGEAIRINPNNASFYNARGKIYGSQGEFDSALNDFNSAVRLDPAKGEYLVNRGVLYEINGMTQYSLADLAVVETGGLAYVPPIEDRDADFFEVYKPITTSGADPRDIFKSQAEIKTIALIEGLEAQDLQTLTLGQEYLKLELWALAVESLTHFLNSIPAEFRTSPYSMALRGRGDALLGLKMNQAAIQDFNRAIVHEPFNEENLISMGKATAATGDLKQAIVDFDEAIRVNPKSSEAFKFKGLMSVLSGDYALAIDDLDKAIEFYPLNDGAYFARAKAYIGTNEPALALLDFAHAINLAPTNTDYLFNRGLLYSELKDYESALEDFSGAIRLKQSMDLNTFPVPGQRMAWIDPRHSKPYVGRGRVYLQMKDSDKAVIDARTAIQLLEGNLKIPEWTSYRRGINLQLAHAHELLGDVFTQLGNTEEAQSEYQIVASLR